MNFKAFIRTKAKGPVTDGTLQLYDRDRQQLTGRLGPRPLNPETAQELEAWLKSKYPKPNTQQRKITALNWLLKWRGIEYVARRPSKQINLHPRVVPDQDYRVVLGRITDPMERIAVRLSHDTFWSPADVVTIRKADVDFSGEVTVIRKVRQKTGVIAEAILEMETVDELRTYVKAAAIEDWLFPGDRRKGKPFRNRTWVNSILRKCGADFSPRAFRSSGATSWPGDDIKGLMTQGGWKSSSTIFEHYRSNVLQRQVKSFERAMGHRAKDPDPEDEPAGYG